MAQPLYYPDWAVNTTTLPGTGNTNKVMPKETIRTYGMDYSQIVTCEEFNWILNNLGMWIRYINDEYIPTLPNTYLPLVGTKISLSGDASGSVTWNGTKEVTLGVTVIDNSHNHLSENITDATNNNVANVLVKRDSRGGIAVSDLWVCSTIGEPADFANILFKNTNYATLGTVTATPAAGGTLSIQRTNPSTGLDSSGIILYDAGYVGVTNPRAATAQETNAASLVRYDYMWQQLNNLQNSINTINTSAVYDVRQSGTGTLWVGSNANAQVPAGCVVTGAIVSGTWDNNEQLYYTSMQIFKNGSWYTIGRV